MGTGLLLIAALMAAPEAKARDANPIFGNASVVPLTSAQNKAVVGKGYYADYYGSYGIDFANYAAESGQWGDYATAASYADYAYQYFSVAAYYQSNGQ